MLIKEKEKESLKMGSTTTSNLLQVANWKPFNGTGFGNWEFRLKLVLEQNGILETIENG